MHAPTPQLALSTATPPVTASMPRSRCLHHPCHQSRPHCCVPSAPPWICPQPHHPPAWPRHPRPHHLDLTLLSCLGLVPPASVAPTLPLSHVMPLALVPPLSFVQHPATCLNRHASLGPPTGSAAASAPGPWTTTCSCHAAAALSYCRCPVMPPLPCHAATTLSCGCHPVMRLPPCHATATLSCHHHCHLLPPPTFLPPPTRPWPD